MVRGRTGLPVLLIAVAQLAALPLATAGETSPLASRANPLRSPRATSIAPQAPTPARSQPSDRDGVRQAGLRWEDPGRKKSAVRQVDFDEPLPRYGSADLDEEVDELFREVPPLRPPLDEKEDAEEDQLLEFEPIPAGDPAGGARHEFVVEPEFSPAAEAEAGEAEGDLESGEGQAWDLPAAGEPQAAADPRGESRAQEHLQQCQSSINDLRRATLASISLDIRSAGVAGKDYPQQCELEVDELRLPAFREGDDQPTHVAWTASGLCHKPLYFEERGLERYGHSTGPYTQPLLSAAHFFGTLPILPYKLGLRTPNECVYTLGHYRPGNCAPYLVPAVPFTLRAGLYQAGATVGAAYLLP